MKMFHSGVQKQQLLVKIHCRDLEAIMSKNMLPYVYGLHVTPNGVHDFCSVNQPSPIIIQT